MRLHALDATATGSLRDFWERYGGGGHRTSAPSADRLIALVSDAIDTGRFTGYVLVQHPHISAIDPSGSRAQSMQKVLQLADERRKAGLSNLREVAYGAEGNRGKPLAKMGRRLDLADRLFDTFLRAIPFAPGSVQHEFRGLVENPERLGYMVGMLVAWAGLHSVAVGEALDGVAVATLITTAILEGTSIAMSFFAILDGARLFSSFLSKVVAAKTEGDLDDAAKDLANAIAAIGVATLINAVALAAAKLRTSERKASRGGAGKGSVLTKEESEALNEKLAKARVKEEGATKPSESFRPQPNKSVPATAETGKGAPPSPPSSPAPQPPAAKTDMPRQYGKSIKIEGGDQDYVNKTVGDLDKIKATKSGKALLDFLENSGKTITIVPTTSGNECQWESWDAGRKADGSKGRGSNSTVSFDANTEKIGTETWATRPPAIGLAHELIHAAHGADGSINFVRAADGETKQKQVPNDSKVDGSNPPQIAMANEDEVRTVGIDPYANEPFSENKIRSEWQPPQPARPFY
ncbi:MAG: M91 family zinc metallopeptidase [Ancalomicrobiaceae bacterium]|nr:M91 family zinc metallopeptidase [Ancalomicrobiaceae bacterium]